MSGVGLGVMVGAHAAPLWTPLREPSRALWYAADQGVTYDGSNRVSAVVDLSGKGRSASQSTDAQKPIYTTGGANGRPSIDFDGSADFMSLSSYTAPLADRIIVAVVNPSDLSTGRWLLDFDVGRTIVAVNESSIGNQIGYYGAGWADSGVAATTGVQILTWEFRAGTTKFYKNGVLLATDAVNAVATALGGVAAAIGSNNGGTSGFFAGKLGLLAIANGKVDDALRIRMERKAAAMFGLPITN